MKVSGTEIEHRIDRFKEACRAANVKLTHQRLEIFREVAESTSHPDAETVFRGVKRRVPSVSLDTVYRTLGLLTELGILFTLGPRRESMRFDANLSPHHHFVCTECGLTQDFEDSGFDSLPTPSGASAFGTVTGAHVELRGICSDCTEKTRGANPRTS